MSTDIGQPTVSVIMPAYNASRFLSEAITSILEQTFTDFELLIVDDGSTDTSTEIARSFGDNRIVIIERAHHGLVPTLNAGLEAARGTYLARMDADDIAEPQRLERQLDHLRETQACVCGTFATTIDERGAPVGSIAVPTTDAAIRRHLLRHNPFIHPSIMMHRVVIATVGRYRERFRHVEDYELWSRVVPRFTVSNIPEPLLQYRIVSTSVTRRNATAMRVKGLVVRLQYCYQQLRYIRTRPSLCLTA